MKFIITGSGGCVSIPRPLCTCNICNELEKKVIHMLDADAVYF